MYCTVCVYVCLLCSGIDLIVAVQSPMSAPLLKVLRVVGACTGVAVTALGIYQLFTSGLSTGPQHIGMSSAPVVGLLADRTLGFIFNHLCAQIRALLSMRSTRSGMVFMPEYSAVHSSHYLCVYARSGQIIFGLLTIVCEMRWRRALKHFQFLTHFLGLSKQPHTQSFFPRVSGYAAHVCVLRVILHQVCFYFFVGGLALGGEWYQYIIGTAAPLHIIVTQFDSQAHSFVLSYAFLQLSRC